VTFAKRIPAAAWLLGLLAFALVIYAPWAEVPFPIVDYSEFLNPLRTGHTFWQSFTNLRNFYESQGRSSYLAYVQLAMNWTLFGERPVAWNVAVFASMTLAVVAAWALLIKLGNTPGAAALATALLMVATPSVHAWLRPTGEPLALLFLCLALMLALSYQQAERWRSRAVVMLLLFLGIGLAKDLLAPLLVVPLAVACCWRDGFRKPQLSERNLTLAIGAAAVAVMLALLILRSVSASGTDAYVRAYSVRNLSVTGVTEKFLTNVLPHTRGYSAGIDAGRAIGNAIFIALALFVIRGAARAPADGRRRVLHEWLGALALAVYGALLYAPLNWYTPFYALPFFLGSTLLFARAQSLLEHRPPLTRRLARGAALCVVLAGALAAFNVARKETAFRRVHGQLADALIAIEGVDSIISMTATNDARQQADEAGFMRHHAIVRGRPAPAARAVRCADYDFQTQRSPPQRPRHEPVARVMLVNYPDLCGALPYATTQFAQPYQVLTPWPGRRYLRLEFVVLERGSPVPITVNKATE
jgi:hypothetical protein